MRESSSRGYHSLDHVIPHTREFQLWEENLTLDSRIGFYLSSYLFSPNRMPIQLALGKRKTDKENTISVLPCPFVRNKDVFSCG